MVSMLRGRAVWQGFTGAPGYTNWFWDYSTGTPVQAELELTTMHDFFNVLKAQLPTDVTISFQTDMALIDSTSGQQTGQVSVADPGQVTGTGSGAYASPTGALVRWTTDVFRNGRQVRGRTFLVPLIASSYDTTGSLTPAAVTLFQTAANGSLTSGDLPRVVFSRPPAGGGAGAATAVTGFVVPDLAVILRTRRD